MNLDAVVTKGRLPWKPCPDARDVDVWHQYEHPHIGTFTSDVGTVIFTVVGGVETDVSVWADACLTPDEARGLDEIEFDSLGHLLTFATHRLVLAVADDLLVTSWAVAEKIGPLYEVAADFLEQVLAQTRRQLNPGARFRSELAAVDVATRELIKSLRAAGPASTWGGSSCRAGSKGRTSSVP